MSLPWPSASGSSCAASGEQMRRDAEDGGSFGEASIERGDGRPMRRRGRKV